MGFFFVVASTQKCPIYAFSWPKKRRKYGENLALRHMEQGHNSISYHYTLPHRCQYETPLIRIGYMKWWSSRGGGTTRESQSIFSVTLARYTPLSAILRNPANLISQHKQSSKTQHKTNLQFERSQGIDVIPPDYHASRNKLAPTHNIPICSTTPLVLSQRS